MELVLATQNPGKVRELKLLLQDQRITIRTLSDFGVTSQDPELGETLEENSESKARAAYEATKKWSLSDDAGVFFPTLDGPGVHTKEWIDGRDDPVEFAEFLRDQFKGASDLTGTFRSVVTLIDPHSFASSRQFFGEVPGQLILEGRGEPTPGLPLSRHFIPNGSEKTLAEMDKQELETYSHRGIALRKVVEHLQSLDCRGN